ncbi:MAG: Translation initiation factor IF-1 [Parcubacteria group bacterium GW2011_GWA1_33_6]|nr:MAG: Translation initiation factor IF-1 [Parcubacteria group bacterium GW2011_GWA2_33_14]KKP54409.1 MAG: Translation initiation factor IF-1 [Parcubacteria group bacterium GW2011_GWA1_33_6]
MESDNNLNISPNSDQNASLQNPVNQELGSLDSKKIIKKEGRVIEALPNAFFKVLLDDGSEIIGFLSGKMRLNRIKILTGDKVTLEMSPYDEKKGRIVYRLK